MGKVRKAVMKIKVEGVFVVDLKDSKSVLAASQALEALKQHAEELGFTLVEAGSNFGNADIEE